MKCLSRAKLCGMLYILLAAAPLLLAQAGGMQGPQSGNAPPRTVSPPIQVRLSGCLKANDHGGYYITDQNGDTWELIPGNNVDLAEHVYHSVIVTGKPASLAPQKEMKSESGEKAEAEGCPRHQLRVLTLKMLSPSCTR